MSSSTTATTPVEKIRRLIEEERESLIAIRRDFHAHPELGYEERRTCEIVERELGAAGVRFKAGLAGGTGVVGSLEGSAETAIGLRADMDALPIEEETGLPYASQNPGVMHACGHDGHTTILIGAARVLSKIAQETPLPNPVTFVFQPAEEGGAGGKRMVEDGCLTGAVLGKPVRHMFGLHGWPSMQLGKVGTRPGPLLAAADKFTITIRGLGSHAAFPHYGHDPVLAGSAVVQTLQSICSRNIDPLDSVVVSVTKFHGGTAFNVIPEEVVLEGTVRTLTPETKERTIARMEEIVQRTAEAHRCEGRLDYGHGYPVTRNDPAAVDIFERHAREAVGEQRVERMANPVMGGEDFSFYCQEVPSCFFALGLAPDLSKGMPLLHHPKFDFNDDAVPLGVEMFCRLALGA